MRKQSFKRYLLRGIVGAGAVGLSLAALSTSYAWAGWVLMPIALWLFRGCPLCWTMGLFEMLARRIHMGVERRG